MKEIIESWLVIAFKLSWIVKSYFLTETIKKSWRQLLSLAIYNFYEKLSLPYKLLKYFLIYLYFNEANQVVLFTLFSRKNVLKSQNWSKIHFQINQKILKAWKNNFNSLTNVLSVGEDLLGTFCKIFRLQSCVSRNHWKNNV